MRVSFAQSLDRKIVERAALVERKQEADIARVM
jgi:hypothetical protein